LERFSQALSSRFPCFALLSYISPQKSSNIHAIYQEDVIRVLIERRVPALWCHCVTQSASVWQRCDIFEGDTVLHVLDQALADGSVVALGDDGWEPVHEYDD
jgi:hypothetical protein